MEKVGRYKIVVYLSQLMCWVEIVDGGVWVVIVLFLFTVGFFQFGGIGSFLSRFFVIIGVMIRFLGRILFGLCLNKVRIVIVFLFYVVGREIVLGIFVNVFKEVVLKRKCGFCIFLKQRSFYFWGIRVGTGFLLRFSGCF